MKTVKERLAYLEAEIKNLQTILSCVDNKDGMLGITLASGIANNIWNDIDGLRLSWLAEHQDEVPK